MTQEPRRRKRFVRARRAGVVALGPRDRAILELLARYRYLRSSFIEAFVGGNGLALRWRLRELFDAGYLARPTEQRGIADALTTPLVYALDRRGQHAIAESGADDAVATDRRARQFLHRLMIDEIVASLELTVRTDPRCAWISPQEIAARAVEVSGVGRPLQFIPPHGAALIPDAVFGIRTPHGVVLYALEADRSTEPLRRSGNGSSYRDKLERYSGLIAGGHYRAALRTVAPLVVLHVALTARRCAALQPLAGGQPFHLFKPLPDATPFGQLLRPNLRLGREPWARDRLPPYSLMPDPCA